MKLPHISTSTKLIIILIAIVFICVMGWMVFKRLSDNRLVVSTNSGIGLTSTQIDEIKMIGQWEFLTVNAEEMIDTTRYGFFGDDELTRIYYGTMRIGIDLNDADNNWIRQVDADSIAVTLPPVRLLNHEFIDETLTQSFLEKGKWTNADREAMRQRAYTAMMRRGLTETNITTARDNGRAQFRNMMHTIGFDKVSIKFSDEKTDK